jgi:pectin methylesterase-like acyl-CoA thioesterase
MRLLPMRVFIDRLVDTRKELTMRNHRISSVFTALLTALAAMVFLAPGRAQAVERRVCKSGCPYTTIRSAVNAALPGDVIKVAKGRYRENIVVKTTKKFSIRGDGTPSSQPGL